jgi:uncharacterized oxidoreductase
MQITGNTVLITGGTSGIGLALAEHFLQLGNKVIICGRRENRLNEIKLKHPEIIVKTCDVSESGQRELLGKWGLKNYPEINVLINNAGIQLLTDLTKPADIDKIKLEIETNFIAPIHLTTLFSKHLSSKKEASIINISSGLAFTPIASMPVYCATKAGIHAITLSLRYQLKNTSVKVFEIIPPSVDTELGQDRRADSTLSHGGMPVTEFIEEAMTALKNDKFEAPVGQAIGLFVKREELFNMLNN